jgi:hypothetical protein
MEEEQMQGYLGSRPNRRVGALLGALALALIASGPAQAQNRNLTATAKYSASSEWQSDQGNTNFIAVRAFDGNLSTRWNSYAGDADGSWLAAKWDQPVSVNKVVIREAFDRITGFRVQQFDSTKGDWVDVVVGEDAKFTALKAGDPANPTFTIRFPTTVQTTGIRTLFTQTNTSSLSIFEVEAYNNPAGTLQGTVRDEQGAAVAGAIVQAGSDSTTTDANGKYSLTADAGTYNITAGKPGAFRTKLVRSVTIAPDSSATLDFALVALPPNLALKAKAASSSDWEDGTDYNAAKANDGNLATRWNSRSDDANGSWLEMDWDAPQTLTKVTVREAFDRIRNYSLQRWDTSKNDWVDIAGNVAVAARGGNPVLANVFAQPITTTKVRLLVVDTTEVPSVYEMEVTNPATATIHGVVKDAVTGQPVPNATVVSDLGETVVADSSGVFSLVVEPDDYVLSAQATGYFQGGGVPVTIKAGETLEVTLTVPAPGPNLAKTGKPIASSEDPSQPASNITDGDLETYWQTATDKHTNEWVGVLFDKPTHFTVVQTRGVVTTVQNAFLQVLADDGKTWVDIPNTNYNREFEGPDRDYFFPQGFTTTGVRWYVAVTHGVEDNPGLSEMLIFDAPLPK